MSRPWSCQATLSHHTAIPCCFLCTIHFLWNLVFVSWWVSDEVFVAHQMNLCVFLMTFFPAGWTSHHLLYPRLTELAVLFARWCISFCLSRWNCSWVTPPYLERFATVQMFLPFEHCICQYISLTDIFHWLGCYIFTQ